MDKKLLRQEFIGMKVLVIGTPVKGTIIDETEQMFIIKTGDEIKKFIKKNNKFKFIFNGKDIVVDGASVVGRPQDRIKSKVKS